MILIDNKNMTHPQMNLALEEYALTHLDLTTDHLLFYINEPSVIIGKHQNTHEEINADFIDKNSIHVVRRVSGGGAVYHDLGNLNFSILTMSKDKVFNDYATFTRPVIQALRSLGVNAELTGRNDIAVDDKKISGNAQYRRGQRMFCHGTLLFNSNLNDVVQALNVKADKIQSKGIQSIRSRVANISDFLTTTLTIEAFKKLLIQEIFSSSADSIPTHHFNEQDWQAITELAQNKYHTWDWNYGKSPEFNVQSRKRFAFGEIDCRLNVKQGVIQEIKIYGDFFAANDIHELEMLLTNRPYHKEILRGVLTTTNLKNYFGELTVDEFLDWLF